MVSKDPSRKIGPSSDIIKFREDPLTALVKAIFLLLKGKLAASSGLLRVEVLLVHKLLEVVTDDEGRDGPSGPAACWVKA